MKLKKIASLALAGVMAVSMLAGCKSNGNGNSNGNSTVVTPSASGIVTAFNDGQDEDNDVKVTFSADAALDAALKKAVEEVGDYEFNNDGAVSDLVTELLGKQWDAQLFNENTNSDNLKDGETATVFSVNVVTSNTYWTEADVVNVAARTMNDAVAELDSTNKQNGLAVGDTYFDYSYTGTVSMVSAEQEGGYTVYYIAVTVTQTATEQTVEA